MWRKVGALVSKAQAICVGLTSFIALRSMLENPKTALAISPFLSVSGGSA